MELHRYNIIEKIYRIENIALYIILFTLPKF